MKLRNKTADIYVPDNKELQKAVSRTTHLGIGAHQDDIEIMAYHGIAECFGQAKKWFGGVTCTNGAGSPRAGVYADYTDEQMQEVRRHEQRQAASLGRYSVMIQLDHASSAIKDPSNDALTDDLEQILKAAQPDIVYTHNPADKHDTHVATCAGVIRAIRRLPKGLRPRRLLGCELWRGLDWLMDEEKVLLDVGERESLAQALIGVFDSQIAGGKRYDLASMGRRRANATYAASHGVDESEQVIYAMDLLPLIKDDKMDVIEYVMQRVNKFADDVRLKIGKRFEKLAEK